MKLLKTFIACIICLGAFKAIAQQSYFNDRFTVKSYTYMNTTFTLYDFVKDGSDIKTKYFVRNAYNEYSKWRVGKNVLLVTAGAFSDSWEVGAIPVGLCVENGTIINRTIKDDWDAMVLVYENASTVPSDVLVIDLSVKNINVRATPGSDRLTTYNVKSSAFDRIGFLAWGAQSNITFFQTQLLYSSDKQSNFPNLYYGDARERRFLALCQKEGVVHHIIVDIPVAVKLNLFASYTKYLLEWAGYSVQYIMNLDTGEKNILYRYNGVYLEDMKPYKGSMPEKATIQNSTNLLVYYKTT